jgi:hypothetical protein
MPFSFMASRTGRNDCVVVGHLGVIEHLGRLRNLGSQQRRGQAVVANAAQDARNFSILVVGQEGGIDARIAHRFLLVQPLHNLERVLGRQPQLVVTLHL